MGTHLFDIYSFSHVSHGILFYLLFKHIKVNFWTGLYLTIILESLCAGVARAGGARLLLYVS